MTSRDAMGHSRRKTTLTGGNMGEVVRRGAVVLREAGEWTPAVHRLLSHLAAAGINGVPRPLTSTIDGREALSFIGGDVPTYPMPSWVWSAEALTTAAELLRNIHDATAAVPFDGPWRSPIHERAEVICHNDFAPYNLVFHGPTVVGAIDWDYASPGPRMWDLAYLAYRIVPLTTAEWGDELDSGARLRRLRELLDAYGTGTSAPELLAVVRFRLTELAGFSDAAAQRLGRPDLAADAALYRTDATHLG